MKTPSFEIEEVGGGGGYDGMQAETTICFMLWWVLFEYRSFDHFPKSLTLRRLFKSLAYNEFPRNVFISHNHMDHSGELPMLFAVESKRRYLAGEPRLRVLCGPEVEHKLKTHRLDEMLSLYKPVSTCWVLLSSKFVYVM